MSERTQIKIRIPQDMKEWIEEQALRNGSSQNSEILRAIRERAARLQETART